MEKNFSIDNGVAIIKVNKNIYPKEVISQTTYVLLEDYYFLIDEEDKYYTIEIRGKNKEITEEDILSFLDELIESQSYLDQLKRTNGVREKILEAALIGQKNKKED